MSRAFAVRIGMLPDKRRHPIKRRICEKAIARTPGLTDWCETEENGTFLFFATLPHAEKAMDAMRRSGNPVSDDIYLAKADRKTKTYHIEGAL